MDKIVEYLKALSDLTRLKIVKFLLERDMYVCELVETMNVAQPTVSQHLRRLKAIGLVEEKKEGQRIRYKLKKDVLQRYNEEFNTFLAKPVEDISSMRPEWERYQTLVAGGKVLDCCPGKGGSRGDV